jgi:hypothetical protein
MAVHIRLHAVLIEVQRLAEPSYIGICQRQLALTFQSNTISVGAAGNCTSA